MFQRWSDLLFLHWNVEPECVQATLPEGLEVDCHEGRAWLGVVPFFMQKVRPRFLPSVGPISNFLELNLRTYVHDASGRPGVWFYSLDASQPVAVRLGRKLFHLPYHDAAMSAERSEGLVDYHCHRRGTAPSERSCFRYGPGEPLDRPEPGSLEYFLLERYYLFSARPDSGRLFAGQVHHHPYPADRSRVERYSTVPIDQAGLTVGGREPDHALFSRGVDVEIFPVFPV